MKKVKLSVAALLIASVGFAQTQCQALTKQQNQCKNTVKTGKLCYLHNPNYTKKCKKTAVICSGMTKSNKNCKKKTKNKSGKCYLHENK